MKSPDREVVLVPYSHQPKGRENVLATYLMLSRSAGSLPAKPLAIFAQENYRVIFLFLKWLLR